MSMSTYRLSEDEVLLLDGNVNAEVQSEIDFIKQARSLHSNRLVGRALAESLKTGTFEFRNKSIHSCPVCKKHAGYYVHARSGRGLLAHRKGQIDHSKPKSMPGIELNPGRVTFAGSGDCCEECNQRDKVVETIRGKIIAESLPIQLIRDKETKFKKDCQRECFSCKGMMYESEMGKLLTLMADGYYPGKCPSCGAEQEFLGGSHRVTGGFRMRAVETEVANA